MMCNLTPCLSAGRQPLSGGEGPEKNYFAAKKTLQADLVQNPDNFFALYGLQNAFLKMNDLANYRKVNKQFKLAYAKSDLVKPGLVY